MMSQFLSRFKPWLGLCMWGVSVLAMAQAPTQTQIQTQIQTLTVWSAGAAQAPMQALVPIFQQRTGIAVNIKYAPVGVWVRALASGAAPDVLLLSADVVAELQTKGWVTPQSVHPLGSVGIGVAVKRGAALPDVSTPEALKNALLKAQSITYMDPQKGTSGKHFDGVLQQLGIADQVKAKTRLGDAGFVLEPVARGEIELGVQQITEILPVQGAQLVGPLPAPLQKITIYSVMLASALKHPSEADAFSQFLQSAQAAEVFRAKGFDVK